MLNVFAAVLRRDLVRTMRQRATLFHHLLFFVLMVALFPLGTQADPVLLASVAPALIWMAVLMSTLLYLPHLFQADADDGTLLQYLIGPEPLAIIALAKIAAFWLGSSLIFVVLGPLLALLLGLPLQAVVVTALSLLLGTPVLACVGAIGAALTLSLPRAGLLLSVLVFPLYVPVLIFGAGVMHAASVGLGCAGGLYALAACLALSVTAAPWATAAALRLGVE